MARAFALPGIPLKYTKCVLWEKSGKAEVSVDVSLWESGVGVCVCCVLFFVRLSYDHISL